MVAFTIGNVLDDYKYTTEIVEERKIEPEGSKERVTERMFCGVRV